MAIQVSTEVETLDDCAVTIGAKAATQIVGLVWTDVTKGVDDTSVIGDIPNDGEPAPLTELMFPWRQYRL